jgi:hypothetical protein
LGILPLDSLLCSSDCRKEENVNHLLFDCDFFDHIIRYDVLKWLNISCVFLIAPRDRLRGAGGPSADWVGCYCEGGDLHSELEYQKTLNFYFFRRRGRDEKCYSISSIWFVIISWIIFFGCYFGYVYMDICFGYWLLAFICYVF